MQCVQQGSITSHQCTQRKRQCKRAALVLGFHVVFDIRLQGDTCPQTLFYRVYEASMISALPDHSKAFFCAPASLSGEMRDRRAYETAKSVALRHTKQVAWSHSSAAMAMRWLVTSLWDIKLWCRTQGPSSWGNAMKSVVGDRGRHVLVLIGIFKIRQAGVSRQYCDQCLLADQSPFVTRCQAVLLSALVMADCSVPLWSGSCARTGI